MDRYQGRLHAVKRAAKNQQAQVVAVRAMSSNDLVKAVTAQEAHGQMDANTQAAHAHAKDSIPRTRIKMSPHAYRVVRSKSIRTKLADHAQVMSRVDMKRWGD